MKIIISLIIFSISLFGYSYKHLEPEELKYIINPKTNKCFKINIDLKTKIINDIEAGTIKYVKTTYRFGTIIELSHSGSKCLYEEPKTDIEKIINEIMIFIYILATSLVLKVLLAFSLVLYQLIGLI